MKVIGLCASPRGENSNVKIALETALEAAAAKGAETELIDVAKLQIMGCQADNYCKAHDGKCAIDDDMQKVYKAIEEADGIILGTPIYFIDVTAQAKLVIDRMYSYFMHEPSQELFSKKTFSIITTNGASEEEVYMPQVKAQLQAFGMLGFQTGEIVTLSENNEPLAIKEKEDQLEKARKVGENII
ncbi:flavodoxin family protein [Methanosphaera sp. WGK6]|uniref:flavodoxin family protein n=1 Tax=Methanosphaera sp. WGK6 TaxID=1561964 RepID=UPI00084C2B65|nr:flavodoxin family protein [Methanosphaera sp. WGK6]OED29892.1 multimeric flavodoxin [Methanosphaera sp. WGK6]